MSITLAGATLAGAGIAAGSSLLSNSGNVVGTLASDVGNYFANKQLQEIDHEFQSNEAKAARAFQANEAEINRDWQTNANAVAMDFNAAESQKQRDYNTYMSNTAHQRKMVDLKAAGLNPILAASQGADIGNGSSATGVAGNVSSPGSAASGRGSTAHSNMSAPRLDFKGITDFVGDYLNSARKISQKADEFQHDIDMQELKQKHSLERLEYSHSKYVHGEKDIPKNKDAEEWFDALIAKQ